MASTIITTNSNALSRAADAILARGDTPSKNAILNALAAAIAGPGHDWGFIKNAPTGSFIQPAPCRLQKRYARPAPGLCITTSAMTGVARQCCLLPNQMPSNIFKMITAGGAMLIIRLMR